MRIDASTYSVAEIKDMLERRDLIVNREYQRGAGIWPVGPRSYFIDTILRGFPFPKLYFYESLDKANRRPRRELVDGQQRVTAIVDFLSDKFQLTNNAKEYSGRRFSDLPDDEQQTFLGYTVAVDVIRNAEEAQILEMFRRMNAYTLPLNDAEKRHSGHQGPFKWFVNRLTDVYSSFFREFDILTDRQIVRMADAELISEIVLTIEDGIISTSPGMLLQLYRKYDGDFQCEAQYDEKIRECFDFIIAYLAELRGTYLTKPYVIHSLCTALLHNKYGLPDVTPKTNIAPTGRLAAADLDIVRTSLEALARAHEAKETEGEFAEYVWSCAAGVNREPRRVVRVAYLLKALQGSLLRPQA